MKGDLVVVIMTVCPFCTVRFWLTMCKCFRFQPSDLIGTGQLPSSRGDCEDPSKGGHVYFRSARPNTGHLGRFPLASLRRVVTEMNLTGTLRVRAEFQVTKVSLIAYGNLIVSLH